MYDGKRHGGGNISLISPTRPPKYATDGELVFLVLPLTSQILLYTHPDKVNIIYLYYIIYIYYIDRFYPDKLCG